MLRSNQLYFGNIIAAIAHLVSVFFFFSLGSDVEWPIYMGEMEYVENPQNGTIPFLYSCKPWGTWNLKFFPVLFSFLSGVFHILSLIRNPGILTFTEGINIFRWIEYSLSAPIMGGVIAILNGISDIFTLILLMTCISTTMIFGLLHEIILRLIYKKNYDFKEENINFKRYNFKRNYYRDDISNKEKYKWVAHLSGWIPYTISWVIIFWSFIHSSNKSKENGSDGPPGFVYAINVIMFVLFSAFAIVQILYTFNKIHFYTSEIFYIILSLVSKLILSWMIYANLMVLS